MLGDLIYEAKNKVTDIRVLDIECDTKDGSYHYIKWNFERGIEHIHINIYEHQ
jgi:hypothetical protein